MNKFKNLTRTSFNNPLARFFISTGLAHTPILSSTAAATLFTCITNALFIESGIEVDLINVAANCPSRETLVTMLHENNVKILALMRKKMKGKKKFYATDGANKKERHMVVKICSFWYNDRVVPLLPDADAVIGDNLHTAEAANFSLQKIDPLNDDGTTTKK